MSAADDFCRWTARFQKWSMVRRPSDPDQLQMLVLRLDEMWTDLPTILHALAAESESAGIDSTPCHELRGVIGTPAMTDAKLDAVWNLAHRVKIKTAAGADEEPASVDVKISDILKEIENAGHTAPAKDTIKGILGEPAKTTGKQGTWIYNWRDAYPKLINRFTDLPLSPKRSI